MNAVQSEVTASKNPIFDNPNQYARVRRLEIDNGRAIIHGYQEFEISRDVLTVLPSDGALLRKRDLLAPLFHRRYLEDRTVLDLGANAAFFSFWALQNGARAATAVDMDEGYLELVEEVKSRLGFQRLSTAKANVVEWGSPADVVLALALIHWIYSCTALLGSLDAAVGKLSRLTNYMLIVEWIDPRDSAIQFFRHLDWNKEVVQDKYDIAQFEAALAKHFARFEVLGKVSETRKLYVAYRAPYEMDLTNPLPFIRSPEHVIYSRCIAECQGVQYWTRIYDDGDVICKQTTGNLAEREGNFLARLKSDYFPKVMQIQSEGNHSLVLLEKIENTAADTATVDANSAFGSDVFFEHCLNLLAELKVRKIVHRDIRKENILIRDGKPVLIDFGWSVDEGETYITPQELGRDGRPPDGTFCDVYSMGKVFERSDESRNTAISLVTTLMTERDGALRITSPSTLRAIFSIAREFLDQGGSIDLSQDGEIRWLVQAHGPLAQHKNLIIELLQEIYKRDRRLAQKTNESWLERSQIAAEELKGLISPGATIILVDEAQLGGDFVSDCRAMPFLERNGQYWGPPADDETAIRELERLRAGGASLIVFAWPAFWWLRHYKDFAAHIDRYSRCIWHNERLIVYDLRNNRAQDL
jgi:serine/threonine protein kinase